MGEAADRYARINRSQWEDYKARFQPIESELMAAFNNPANTNLSINRAQAQVANAFQQAETTRDLNMSRYGLQETADQQRVNNRQAALAKTASLGMAADYARNRAKDRDLELAAGTVTSGGRSYSTPS